MSPMFWCDHSVNHSWFLNSTCWCGLEQASYLLVLYFTLLLYFAGMSKFNLWYHCGCFCRLNNSIIRYVQYLLQLDLLSGAVDRVYSLGGPHTLQVSSQQTCSLFALQLKAIEFSSSEVWITLFCIEQFSHSNPSWVDMLGLSDSFIDIHTCLCYHYKGSNFWINQKH